MYCRKCRTGRVFIDRLYPQDKRIELFCMQCGKRWFIKNNKGSAFSEWLSAIESERRTSYATSS